MSQDTSSSWKSPASFCATGTLTQNDMAVVRMWAAGSEFRDLAALRESRSLGNGAPGPGLALDPAVVALLTDGIAANSTAELRPSQDGVHLFCPLSSYFSYYFPITRIDQSTFERAEAAHQARGRRRCTGRGLALVSAGVSSPPNALRHGSHKAAAALFQAVSATCQHALNHT